MRCRHPTDLELRRNQIELETAVGCARVCRDWCARQGKTTEWACAHKAEQPILTRQARCNRVHSAVNYQVTVIEAEKVNAHAVFLKFASGQLPFPGSCICRKARRLAAMSEGDGVIAFLGFFWAELP